MGHEDIKLTRCRSGGNRVRRAPQRTEVEHVNDTDDCGTWRNHRQITARIRRRIKRRCGEEEALHARRWQCASASGCDGASRIGQERPTERAQRGCKPTGVKQTARRERHIHKIGGRVAQRFLLIEACDGGGAFDHFENAAEVVRQRRGQQLVGAQPLQLRPQTLGSQPEFGRRLLNLRDVPREVIHQSRHNLCAILVDGQQRTGRCGNARQSCRLRL